MTEGEKALSAALTTDSHNRVQKHTGKDFYLKHCEEKTELKEQKSSNKLLL